MKSLISTFSKYTFLSICFTIIISIFSFHSTNAQNFVNKGIGSFEKISGDGLPPGWEYLPNTGNPHGLIIVLGANPRINDIPINDGDYIGAFYEDDFGALKCGGADVWNGTENIIFPVFGDNPDTPEKDGFSYNETMRFRIYYQNNQKDYEVTQIAWDPNYYGTNKWNPLGVSSAIDVLCTVGFDAYATVSENPVCLGQTINLDAQVFIETTGNYSYSWLSDPIGLNSNLASISHTPAESTTYYLEVSDGLDISTHQQHVFVFENPQVYAPDTINICKNQTAQLSAEVINYSGVIWSTEGDGTFFNPGSLNAIYHPGNADKANGSARLSIKAFPKSPCLNDATDTTLIVLKSPAEITLPATLEFCELEEMMVEAEASLFSAVLWASSGDGTFSNPDSLLTQYFPGPSDLSINEFLLSATAFSISPCQVSVSDQVFVSTYNGPTLSAPTSRTVCETSSVNLNSVAFNYTSSLWTTAGDGTFDNPQLLNTIYHPGTGDIETGGNIVTVHAFGNGICQEYSVSKNIQIILKVLPTADAGNDQPVCIGGTVNLSGTATNQSYLTWSSSGDGYFDNIYSPSPVYYPGSIDFSSQTFSLFLSAFANYPCTLPSVDTVEIEVLPEPEVEIGLNTASVCFGANYYFEQTVAYNYSTLNWFTINGTGTFDDNSNLNPIYFPDPGHDYSLGSVIVGISVQSLEPCTSVADDFMTLVMQAPPEIDAGEDFTIIEGQTFNPQAMAENYSSVFWSTSGDGTFNSNLLLNPEYFPGVSDLNSNIALLTVIAAPMNGCTVSDSDDITLTILNSQNITLTEGTHSFSTYIDTEGMVFEEIIAPIAENIIFAQKFLQVYWPEYNINTFEGFDDSPGCKILVDADTLLKLTGYRKMNKTIALNPGWNYLPVLSTCDVNVQYLSDQLGLSLIIITEIDGDKVVYPSGDIHTLNELLPGKSYLIKVGTAVDITFPECYE